MTKEEIIQKLIKGGMTAKEACAKEGYPVTRWYARPKKNKRVLRTSVEVSEVVPRRSKIAMFHGTTEEMVEVLRLLLS